MHATQETDRNGACACLVAWLSPSGPAPRDIPNTAREWAELVTNATALGLAGLILERARRDELAIPPDFDRVLRGAAMAVAAANLHIEHELGRLAHALNQANVDVMVLKGAALNLTVYDRPDLRPMSDLDLLVRPESIETTLEVLKAQGCRRGFDLVRDDFFPRYHYELELTTDSPRPVRIDLHVRPFRPVRISRTMPDDALWDGANRFHVCAGSVHVPRPELMLIHLAAHAAFHGCSRLIWLYDIRRLVDRYGPSLDWSIITRNARDWRLTLPVLHALRKTGEWFGAVCPAEVNAILLEHPVSWKDRLVLRQAPHDAASPMAHVLVDLLCTPGIAFRAGYLRAFLAPGKKHLADVYPYRHVGWTVCAHALRVLRRIGALASSPFDLLLRTIRRFDSPPSATRTACAVSPDPRP